MKILKILLVGIVILIFTTSLAYADSNGKGNGADNGQAKGHEKQAEERANPASNAQQERQSQPDRPAPAPQRNTEVHIPQAQPRSGQERANHPTIAQPSMPTQRASQGDTRNSTSSRANGQERNQTKTEKNKPVRVERDRSANRVVTGKDENRVNLADVVGALERARWSYNPHDTRGQGNVGKPRMQPPYGFDKDSGREKKERRRPIKEASDNDSRTVGEVTDTPTDNGIGDNNNDPTTPAQLNMADMLSIDFTITDVLLSQMQQSLEYNQTMAQQYSSYASAVPYIENYIAAYSSTPYDNVIVTGYYQDTINYNLTFTPPAGFEGKTLLVTTSLTNIFDYDSVPESGIWSGTNTLHYDAGQVIIAQTQEVVLGSNNTFSFSYDPPTEVTGAGLDRTSGIYAELAVTVTEPESGQKYTMTYDRQIYLYRQYRCPYGKVYNTKTSQPVVGAKITVHFEDGSIVPLDKASNPTAKNPQVTDATGRYGVKLETNRKYYITAKADGYEDYKSEVFTEKWHVLREDIALTPLEQVAQK